MMSRFLGLLHYFNICYYSYHLVSDLEQVSATSIMECFKTFKDLQDVELQENDTDIDITVQNLKGALNLCSFPAGFCNYENKPDKRTSTL